MTDMSESKSVVLIRRDSGERVRALATAFGVSIQAVEGVIYRRTFRHISFRRVEAVR